ncbi:MAG TPA: hypothetical protein VLW45_08315 [Pelomicrobium sp.]|nr:hypothetical protein [Pelomicrobium sp.]
MPVHVQVDPDPNTPVIIEFRDVIDTASRDDALIGFERIHRIWWRDVLIVLRRITRLEPASIELLLYFRERASRCSLRLIGCAPPVLQTLEATGLPRYCTITTEQPGGESPETGAKSPGRRISPPC